MILEEQNYLSPINSVYGSFGKDDIELSMNKMLDMNKIIKVRRDFKKMKKFKITKNKPLNYYKKTVDSKVLFGTLKLFIENGFNESQLELVNDVVVSYDTNTHLYSDKTPNIDQVFVWVSKISPTLTHIGTCADIIDGMIVDQDNARFKRNDCFVLCATTDNIYISDDVLKLEKLSY